MRLQRTLSAQALRTAFATHAPALSPGIVISLPGWMVDPRVCADMNIGHPQYDLVDIARQHGFIDVEVIDDDFGRSASGTVARPGFDRLVAWLCAGRVGAVLCQDASRLARNGRDWHHLLELCGLVEARVIDHDGIYNPCQPNDRLLLGMKGSISEFELGVLRTRMLDAAKAKARRGELRLSVPFGYIWHREAGLGLDPDLRLQEPVGQVVQVLGKCSKGPHWHVTGIRVPSRHMYGRPNIDRRNVGFDHLQIRMVVGLALCHGMSSIKGEACGPRKFVILLTEIGARGALPLSSASAHVLRSLTGSDPLASDRQLPFAYSIAQAVTAAHRRAVWNSFLDFRFLLENAVLTTQPIILSVRCGPLV